VFDLDRLHAFDPETEEAIGLPVAELKADHNTGTMVSGETAG
jgi:hypothetical protein